MSAANNPELRSWIEVDKDSDFPIQNLPFGIFSSPGHRKRAGVAIGDYVLDLDLLHELGYFSDLEIRENIFSSPYLNDFIALGRKLTSAAREKISEILNAENGLLRDNHAHRERALYLRNDVEVHLPVKIGDYTDFYSSIEHATNVGIMFRDPANALLPNWRHMPVGYHGRSSSIFVSGTDVRRPRGQVKADDAAMPEFVASRQLDFELELAFVIGKQNESGKRITTFEADEHIFGLLLFNDWSARDIQKWEYVPLGPFLGKNFASSVSPWIVTMDALEPFRVAGPVQNPQVLPYLQYEGNKNIDIELEVYIQPEHNDAVKVCHSNFKYMYWNMNQQLAHHTVNGCNMQVGDVCASGTISGPDAGSYGSMLELAWKGTKPIEMPDGSTRKFIQDGDSVVMKGYAQKNGVRIGFGEVRNKVIPAI